MVRGSRRNRPDRAPTRTDAPDRPEPACDAQPTPPAGGKLRAGVVGTSRLVALGACGVGSFFALKVTIAAYWIASGLEGSQAAVWWTIMAIMLVAALLLGRETVRNALALCAIKRELTGEAARRTERTFES